MSRVIPDKGMIDATQDAVLSAASDVVQVLENTAQGLDGVEPFYLHAEFWVGAAFVLTIVGLAKPVGRVLLKMLRGRGQAIADRIREASDLKEDAQKLLAEYERKFRGAEKEAADILARAERETDIIKRDTLSRLEAEMAIREKEAKARLKAAEVDAMREVTMQTAELTIAAVRKILVESLDEKAQNQLIDASIEYLKKRG